MNFQRLAARVPPQITRRLQNTAVDSLFTYLRRRFQKVVRVFISTPQGKIPVLVYDDWPSLDTVEKGRMYERATYEAFKREIEDLADPVVFDVGSHWGITVKYALELGASGECVYAYEADKHNFLLLERNLDETRVTRRNRFVGVSQGSYDLANENVLPDIVKIDVEGAEWDVLQSLANTGARPTIILEVHPHLLADGPGPDDVTDGSIIAFLQRKDYELTFFEQHDDGDRETEPPLPSREPYLIIAR